MYGDLKPENVVAPPSECSAELLTGSVTQRAEITSSNHAKLTDFGGCRPVTDEALQIEAQQRAVHGDLESTSGRIRAAASGSSLPTVDRILAKPCAASAA